jgi:transposase
MKPFSVDLRQRVLADYEAGLSFAALGRKYSTSAEWVRQFIRRYQATGEIAARPPIPKTVPFHRRHEVELRAAIAEQPDLTLEALRTKLGLPVSLGTLHNALRALKLSFKKNSRRGRADSTRRRRRPGGVPGAATSRPRSAAFRLHR